MSEDMQRCLESYCARAFPAQQGLRVTGLARMSAGWEADMYSFAVESGPAEARQHEELILRIYPGADAHEKSAREYHGMRRLHGAGYPVPRVLALERGSPFDRAQGWPFDGVYSEQSRTAQGELFGNPFVIMEKVQGRMMWPLWFGAPEERQRELLTLFCQLFVQLHTLEFGPDVVPHDTGDPYAFVDRELDKLRPYLARFPIPGFQPIVAWLEARRDRVPCERPSVVHWDLHPGNILLGDDGSATVVDWTQVDVSDPRFDLAWTLLLVSTYEGEVWHRRIRDEYERLAGARMEQLAFFEVYACLKRLYTLAASLTYGPVALGMRPEAGKIMVRQMEASKRVYDLLVARTGIEVPEVEKLLAQSSDAAPAE